MPDHEFYAQPTVFDHWHASIGSWLCLRFSGLCPYSWVIGFGVLGSIFLITAMTVLAVTLSSSTDSTALLWNHSMAQGLTVLVGLTAAQTLFRQALDAWPADTRLPAVWRRIGHYVGWRQPVQRQLVSKQAGVVVRLPRPAPVSTSAAADQQAVQAFFSGVRAAGINVAIARALFGAGIRSPQHLLRARDEQLFSIHGVGPATVRKLRSQFQGQ
jgi:hypothetical protein